MEDKDKLENKQEPAPEAKKEKPKETPKGDPGFGGGEPVKPGDKGA